MLFNSINFILFFPVVFIVYYLMPKKFQYLWLLVTSYFFYMCWNAKYALLLLASTAVTYIGAILIDWVQVAVNDPWKKDKLKKAVVAVSVLINLGFLCFFKYGTWLLSNVDHVLHKNYSMPFDIILPVGISFYIFQALSYTIDVYRGTIEVERNFFRYALFVSFFPQLVAGPIERSGNLLEQLRKGHDFCFENIRYGFLIVLLGYFEKIVIADRVAAYVNVVFNNYEAYGSLQLILAILGFSVQIYCDFSGYSHIAIGTARMLGIHLMDNFRQPYFAMDIRDFWNRWHISLSSWFRDYLYIPLGGNRCSNIRHYINILVTFLLSGLWHGAAWHFVFWGGIHGVYRVTGEILKPLRRQIERANPVRAGGHLVKCFITFGLTSFAWLFFRANSLSDAVQIIRNIFGDAAGHYCSEWGMDGANITLLLLALIVLILISMAQERNISIYVWLNRQEKWFPFVAYFVFTILILVFGIWGDSYNAASFIYFQF